MVQGPCFTDTTGPLQCRLQGPSLLYWGRAFAAGPRTQDLCQALSLVIRLLTKGCKRS